MALPRERPEELLVGRLADGLFADDELRPEDPLFDDERFADDALRPEDAAFDDERFAEAVELFARPVGSFSLDVFALDGSSPLCSSCSESSLSRSFFATPAAAVVASPVATPIAIFFFRDEPSDTSFSASSITHPLRGFRPLSRCHALENGPFRALHAVMADGRIITCAACALPWLLNDSG